MRGTRPARTTARLVMLALLALFPFASVARAATTITVTTTKDELDVDGKCSLREAIRAANTDTAVDSCPAGSGADTIVLPHGIYTLSIAGTSENASLSGDLDVTKSLTIQGAGASTTIVDANHIDRVFEVIGATNTSTFAGMTIRNGVWNDSNGLGGGILNEGATLTLNGDVVTGNATPQSFGGGINLEGGSLTIVDSAITNNTSYGTGGGLVNNGSTGSLSITNSLISGNAVTGTNGGGGLSSNGPLDVTNTIVQGNTSASYGGIAAYGRASVTDSTIAGNVASVGDCGGLLLYGGMSDTVVRTVVRSSVTDNLAESPATAAANRGGGICALAPNVSIRDSTVSGNRALGDPSAMPATYDAGDVGGGIYVESGGALFLTGSTVNGNQARDGDGVYNKGTATISNSTISDNGTTASPGNGGGIDNVAGHSIALSNDTIAQNASSASGGGGNIYSAGTGTVKNTIVAYQFGGTNCEEATLLTSLGHNLVDEGTCFVATGSDLIADPMLDMNLKDNGGPTWTHALLSGSPAIDAGAGCETTDQRGFVRPQGSACDIGAFEVLQFFPLTVTKTGTGAGTVTSSPPGISCGADCSESYAGATVTLTAAPSAGSSFAGWSGACTGTSTCTVTMTAARSVTATFVAVPPPVVTCTVPRLRGKTLP